MSFRFFIHRLGAILFSPRSIVRATAALLSATAMSRAVDGVWTQTGVGGGLSNVANRQCGTIAAGAGSDADFNGSGTTVDRNIARSVVSLDLAGHAILADGASITGQFAPGNLPGTLNLGGDLELLATTVSAFSSGGFTDRSDDRLNGPAPTAYLAEILNLAFDAAKNHRHASIRVLHLKAACWFGTTTCFEG